MPVSEEGASLRVMTTAVTVAVSIVAALVALALILLSGWQRSSADTMNSVLHSVDRSENLQVKLLAHSQNPTYQMGVALRRDFRALGRHVTTADEAKRYAAAGRALDAHLQSPEDPDALQAAVLSLEQVVNTNLDQAEEAFASARRTDVYANTIALGLASVILLLAASLLLWLRRSAIRPIVALADALRRLQRGEQETRVAKSGPRELRAVAEGFNCMAEALGRQRTNQLTFIAGVAHDLRTPVSTLRLSLSSMAAEPDRTTRLLVIAQRQVDRLERMVGDLADAAQIESGHLELRMSRGVDLADIARNTHELFGGQDAERGRLRVELPDRPVCARADAARLEQVTANLVSNALKYSPEGGEVVLSVGAEAGWGVLSVRDRGIGLTEEEKATLFEPFRRVGPLRDRIPGVGLGLSVARRIVAAHGGTIDVESAPGRGSTFRVRLPLEPQEGAVTHAQ